MHSSLLQCAQAARQSLVSHTLCMYVFSHVLRYDRAQGLAIDWVLPRLPAPVCAFLCVTRTCELSNCSGLADGLPVKPLSHAMLTITLDYSSVHAHERRHTRAHLGDVCNGLQVGLNARPTLHTLNRTCQTCVWDPAFAHKSTCASAWRVFVERCVAYQHAVEECSKHGMFAPAPWNAAAKGQPRLVHHPMCM